MAKRSAGLLLYRFAGNGDLEVLLVHPGGPFWARKDLGAWSIPKGEYVDGEDPHEVAIREFTEELGSPPPQDEGVADIHLGEVRQSGGKVVTAWARHGAFDSTSVISDTFEMEWPPKSGRTQAFPEVDRADWFDISTARTKLVKAQTGFLDALEAALN